MPRAYANFLHRVRALEFEERPPYRQLIGSLRDVLTVLGIAPEDCFYDWDMDHVPVDEMLRQ